MRTHVQRNVSARVSGRDVCVRAQECARVSRRDVRVCACVQEGSVYAHLGLYTLVQEGRECACPGVCRRVREGV